MSYHDPTCPRCNVNPREYNRNTCRQCRNEIAKEHAKTGSVRQEEELRDMRARHKREFEINIWRANQRKRAG